MSAITAVPSWETPTPLSRTPRVGPVRKRHLHAVPARTASPAATRHAGAARHRVTRKGRLLLTTAATAVLVAASIVGARAAIGGGPGAAFDTVTVQSGQTLSQLAHDAYPGMSVANAVQRVQAANNLNTNHVYGGERLRLPR